MVSALVSIPLIPGILYSFKNFFKQVSSPFFDRIKCEYASGKYRIDFQDVESDIEVYQLEDGLVKLEPEKTKKYIKENRIFLDNHTFQKDAVIMKNIKSDRYYIKKCKPFFVNNKINLLQNL